MAGEAAAVVVSIGYAVADELPLDEMAMIARIVRGERELFRELVSKYKNVVFSIIMRQVGNHSIAEELAQEAFIKAFRALPAFRGEASFKTWITRIAVNTSNSYFESKQYKQMRQTETLDPIHHDQPVEHAADESLEISLFRRALTSLTPKLRDALILVGLEGKRYEEAANVLGIPVGTVRSRLNKARLAMRDEVARFRQEEAKDE